MFGFCGCCGWRRPLREEIIEERPIRRGFCGCCGWGRGFVEPPRREFREELHHERAELRRDIHHEKEELRHLHNVREEFPGRRFY